MKKSSLPLAFGVSVLTLAVSIPESHADFLGIFKKKPDQQAPSASEADRMESQASAELQGALAKEQSGNLGSAEKAYKSIVGKFPLTDSAALAQYKVGEIKERQGDLSSAFDAYQEFLDRYRRSTRFEQALGRQYAIAEKAQSGAKDKFLGIPRKFQDSRVIEMFEAIIKNAPFGKIAPLAQFNIAEIYQADGNKEDAVHNYQLVVDNYSNSPKKDEALFRIGAINNTAARFSHDPSAIQDARDNLELYLSSNPEGDRAGDATAIMQQLDTRQATKDFEIAQFYDKRGNHRAAMMYYKDLASYTEFENHAKVVQRMEIIAKEHPEALALPGAAASLNSSIPALASTKTRDDYVGPPAPNLAKLTEKPQMRIGDDLAPMGPIDEPDLPSGTGSAAANPLLPGGSGETNLVPLIIPPAPEGGTVAIPPAPGGSDLVIPPLPGSGLIPPSISPISSPPTIPGVDLTPAPSSPNISIPPPAAPSTPVVPPIPPAPSSETGTPATPPAKPDAGSKPVTPEIPPLPELPEIPVPPAPSEG